MKIEFESQILFKLVYMKKLQNLKWYHCYFRNYLPHLCSTEGPFILDGFEEKPLYHYFPSSSYVFSLVSM